MSDLKRDIVLIVDDNPNNLQLAASYLAIENYDVAVASSSKEALEVIEEVKPDLILLDIMMPETNGFELCKILKGWEETSEIPVIFLTAMKESQDIIHAFEVGGVDFISKPFKQKELLARVKTHIDLLKSRKIIQKQNENLIQANDKLKKLSIEKDGLIAITSHDLRNPLHAINNYLETIEQNIEKIEPEQLLNIISSAKTALHRAIHISTDLIDIHELETGIIKMEYQIVSAGEVIEKVINSYKEKADRKSIKLNTILNEEIHLKTDENKLERILDNLISNAIKFSEPNKEVNVVLTRGPNVCTIMVEDFGPGIKQKDMSELFKKFGKISNKPTGGESSSRLGLSIVGLLTEKMKGRVWCESQVGVGSKFFIVLPTTI